MRHNPFSPQFHRPLAGVAMLLLLLTAWRYLSTPLKFNEPPPPDSPSPALRLDPNTATLSELASLPGIGKTRAAALISHRTTHPILTPEDLQPIKGFGPSTIESLLPYLRFPHTPPP